MVLPVYVNHMAGASNVFVEKNELASSNACLSMRSMVIVLVIVIIRQGRHLLLHLKIGAFLCIR